ncbi:hypothetical protein GCM10022246_15360 [Pedobacter ginsengiterrae]|uniref:Uncharacterized protein n=1 Tax=Pedobacter ginsengiterrae TaxID=871696 RepID=A0ABP7PBT3_9SPHI
MTDKGIQTVIDHCNRPNKKTIIIPQPIGFNVDYGLVWTDIDHYNLGDVSPYKFYLIKDKSFKCIGAVLDMKTDLHWYITPKSRKKGFLTNALKDVILPHISKSRKEQRITINKNDIGKVNFEASLNTAKGAGFRFKTDIGDYVECIQKLAKHKKKSINTSFQGMDFERMGELRKKMNAIVGSLWHIQAELEMKLGQSNYTRYLIRTINELQNYRIYKMDDALHDFIEEKDKL